jgi:hypothetical protein
MTLAFVIIATVFFFLLGVAWKKSDFPNFFVKFILIGMSVFGILVALNLAGIIIKS